MATTRQPSVAALAAKSIRKDLKSVFPGVTFSVRSESFAGGNAVDVAWTDGPEVGQVRSVVGKYQYGHFDGMFDIYEYSNQREDLPQAKFVQCQRRFSQAVYRKAIAWANARYGWSLVMREDTSFNQVEPDSDEMVAGSGTWASHMVSRELHDMSLYCQTCHVAADPGDVYCAECGAVVNASLA